MKEPLWDRIKQATCRWIGHRERSDEYVIWCARCRRALRKAEGR